MNEKEWKIEYELPEIPAGLSEAGFSPLLCCILALRGVRTAEEAHALLGCDSSVLSDPFLMKGMEQAVKRIRAAITHGEAVAVYGDYDVDGVTSAYILTKGIKTIGGNSNCCWVFFGWILNIW